MDQLSQRTLGTTTTKKSEKKVKESGQSTRKNRAFQRQNGLPVNLAAC